MANSEADAGGSELEIRKKLIEQKSADVIVAVSSNFFIDVATFGPAADACAEYLSKGRSASPAVWSTGSGRRTGSSTHSTRWWVASRSVAAIPPTTRSPAAIKTAISSRPPQPLDRTPAVCGRPAPGSGHCCARPSGRAGLSVKGELVRRGLVTPHSDLAVGRCGKTHPTRPSPALIADSASPQRHPGLFAHMRHALDDAVAVRDTHGGSLTIGVKPNGRS
jgi:hypothetical protein